MSEAMEIYLLSIPGKLAPKTLEDARKIHNETAGAPANVAAARSLSDLSHMVFVPMDHGTQTPEKFLILDQWNKPGRAQQVLCQPRRAGTSRFDLPRPATGGLETCRRF